MYQGAWGLSGGHHHRSNVKGATVLHYLTHISAGSGLLHGGDKLIRSKTSKIDVNVQLNEPMFDKKAKQVRTPLLLAFKLQVTHRQAHSNRWATVRQKSLNQKVAALDGKNSSATLPDIPEVRLDWATYLDQMELADQHTKIVIEDDEKTRRDERTPSSSGWETTVAVEIRGQRLPLRGRHSLPSIISGKGIEKGKVVNDLARQAWACAISSHPGFSRHRRPKHMHGQALLNNPNYQLEGIRLLRKRSLGRDDGP